MIKAVFFDCDGTLLSHNSKSVPKSARKTIELLKQQGIKVVLATGRHYLELMQLPICDIDFDGYILLNGQICLDENKNVLFSNPMQDYQQIQELFNERKMPIQILHLDEIYINFVNEVVLKTLEDISTTQCAIKEFQEKEIYQAICYGATGNEDYLESKLPHCKLTRWNDGAIDILPNSGDKCEGIKKYCQINNIAQEETMSFGDGVNDIDMLKYTHISIAVGNSEKAVKQVADFVSSDIDDDGIYNGYLHYFKTTS